MWLPWLDRKKAGDRIRTRDILSTNQALYQLSYSGVVISSNLLTTAQRQFGARSTCGVRCQLSGSSVAYLLQRFDAKFLV